MRILAFVSIAGAVYAALHAVVLWGVHPLLRLWPGGLVVVLGWMGLAVAGLFVAPLLERARFEAAARAVAWLAYTWLGFLFLAAVFFGALAVGEALLRFAGWWRPSVASLSLHGPAAAAVGVVAVLAVGVYGLFEAARVRVETVVLPAEGIAGRLRLVQVSDLHLGLLLRERTLAPVVAAIQDLQPDLVVATGDVVDAQVDHLEELGRLWRQLEPPLGKYAVVGNHEAYAGLSHSLAFLEGSGFTVLRNEGRDAGRGLWIAGVDDPHAGGRAVDEGALSGPPDPGRFTVLLKHRPEVAPGAAGRFDLQLSGHAHLGQIFPFRFVTGLRYPLQDGLYELPGGGHLYASRGTGTWGPPMRVLARPEITVFDLVPGRKREREPGGSR